MKREWVRKDFSKDSPIREPLLKELLKRSSVQEIPEQYDEWIAAAGIPDAEQSVIDKARDPFKKK